MMPISELLRLDATVDEDGHSAVADAVADRWDIGAHAAEFWRSSATHLFRVAESIHGPCFVRFVPEAMAAGLVAGTRATERLGAADATVAPVIASSAGANIEVVATELGPVTEMVVAEVPGESLESDTLTVEQANGWGAALARFHVAGRSIDTSGLNTASGAAGSSDSSSVGVLHGDFELDNLRCDAGRWTAFDLDGVTVGPYLLDIAAAIRDLLDGGALPTAGRNADLLDAFLAGYATVRPEETPRFAGLPRFIDVDAAQRDERLQPIANELLPADAPEWAHTLRARVAAVAGLDVE